jgi:hypothetical protein
MRSCSLSTTHAAGARVYLPLPDVPEGIRSAVHGVRERQASRPTLDARAPVDLRELERRRAELLQCLRHSPDVPPRGERQHRRDNRQPGRPRSCTPGRAVWHRERAVLDQWAQSAARQEKTGCVSTALRTSTVVSIQPSPAVPTKHRVSHVRLTAGALPRSNCRKISAASPKAAARSASE